MKAANLAILAATILVGCTTTDPIDHFEANPPTESEKYDGIFLPSTASAEQVIRAAFGPEVRILKVRRVNIRGTSSVAALISLAGRGRRIASFAYAGKDRGGWIMYDFPAN